MAAMRKLVIDVSLLRRHRRFRLLILGIGTSSIGSRVTDIAMARQLYRLTHSTLAVGLLGLVVLVPRLALSLYGGALADTVDRARLLRLTELTSLAALVVLIANSHGHGHVWLIYAAAVVQAAAHSLASPAMTSAIPTLVDDHELVGALAIRSFLYATSWLAGPAIAGVLTGTIGFGATYTFDLATTTVGVVSLFRLGSLAVADPTERAGLRSIATGMRYVARQPVVLGAFAFDLNAMIFGFPVAIFPAFIDGRFHGRWLANFLYAAPFVGSLVVSAVSKPLERVRRQGAFVAAMIVVWGLALAAFGAVTNLPAALALLAVAGGADMASGVVRSALLLAGTPPELRGRVEGVGMAVWTTGPALGDLEAGVVAHVTSPGFAVVSGGLACVAGVGVLAAAIPGFIAFRRPEPSGNRSTGDGPGADPDR